METKHVITAIAILLGAIAIYFSRGSHTSGTTMVEPSSIQPGPIRHDRLDDALVARIRAFEPVLADIYPMTHEKWVEGFQRDLNPESEIAIWESIAAAWQRVPTLGTLTLDERKEAFGILLVRSASDDVHGILAGLKHLSRNRAETLLSFYTVPPKPVTVESR